jgi:hypothetical protein
LAHCEALGKLKGSVNATYGVEIAQVEDLVGWLIYLAVEKVSGKLLKGVEGLLNISAFCVV